VPSKTHISFLAKAWSNNRNKSPSQPLQPGCSSAQQRDVLFDKTIVVEIVFAEHCFDLVLGSQKKKSNSMSLATLRERLGMVWWKHCGPTSTHYGCNIWGLLGLQKSFPDRDIRLSPGSPSHWTVNFSWRAACTSGLQQGFQGTDATRRHERNRDLDLEILLAYITYIYIYIYLYVTGTVYMCVYQNYSQS